MAHEVVQGPQRFLQRRVAVPSVHLVKVDVISLQSPETSLHFAHDVHTGGTTPIEVFTHGEPDLCSQNYFCSNALQGVTQQRLALPEAVDVRRINEIDPLVQSQLHHPSGFLLTKFTHIHLAPTLPPSQPHLT